MHCCSLQKKRFYKINDENLGKFIFLSWMDRDLFASFVCSFSFWQKYIVCFLSPPAPFIRPIAAAVASLSSSHSLSLSPPIYHTIHTHTHASRAPPFLSPSFSYFAVLVSLLFPFYLTKAASPCFPTRMFPAASGVTWTAAWGAAAAAAPAAGGRMMMMMIMGVIFLFLLFLARERVVMPLRG